MDRIIEQKDSHVPATARREIDRNDPLALNLRGLPIDPWPSDRADSPPSNDLDRWLTAATQGAEENWAEFIKVENTNAWAATVGIGLVLLVTLIAFATVCWEGIGWVCESILMPK